MAKPVVLHIDDSQPFRETFALVFRRAGLSVISRRDGDEAGNLLPGTDYHCLVVDSSGMGYVRSTSLRRRDAGVAAIALTAVPSSETEAADIVLAKSDGEWHRKVVEAVMSRTASRFSSGATIGRGRDLFAGLSPDEVDRYRGKILVVARHTGAVIGVAESLAEAERIGSEVAGRRGGCRLVQGPPVEAISLAELEGR